MFNSIKGVKYFNKKEREKFYEPEQPLSEKERVVTIFLKNHAVEVLQATARGKTISQLEKARELLKELKELK